MGCISFCKKNWTKSKARIFLGEIYFAKRDVRGEMEISRNIKIALIMFCLINLYAQEKSETLQEWSNYQGHMNWKNAKAKCASIGMRLPSIAELKAAFKAKVTESWKAEWDKSAYFSIYWTSEEYSERGAYNFYADGGFVDYFDKGYGYHVRCIR